MNLAFLIVAELAVGVHFTSGSIVGWTEDYLKWCKVPQSQNDPDDVFDCTFYVWNYMRVNVEVLSADPVIIVYRDLIPRPYVKQFLKEIRAKKVKEQSSKHVTDGASPQEITMQHHEGKGSARVYDFTSAMIPAVNFSASEPWQILSYKSGDSSPPRYDFIEKLTNKERRKYGNRFATFMVLLKKADTEGYTIFPAYKITVVLEEGDAVFWTVMNAKEEKSIAALHGGCPVGSGQKVTASLRIRANEQLLTRSPIFAGLYNGGLLIRPDLFFAD